MFFFSFSRYQMWLEAYLRNGKVIQSNVLEVQTEDGQYDPLAGETIIVWSKWNFFKNVFKCLYVL